jgi:hypothetical protein
LFLLLRKIHSHWLDCFRPVLFRLHHLPFARWVFASY